MLENISTYTYKYGTKTFDSGVWPVFHFDAVFDALRIPTSPGSLVSYLALSPPATRILTKTTPALPLAGFSRCPGIVSTSLRRRPVAPANCLPGLLRVASEPPTSTIRFQQP